MYQPTATGGSSVGSFQASSGISNRSQRMPGGSNGFYPNNSSNRSMRPPQHQQHGYQTYQQSLQNNRNPLQASYSSSQQQQPLYGASYNHPDPQNGRHSAAAAPAPSQHHHSHYGQNFQPPSNSMIQSNIAIPSKNYLLPQQQQQYQELEVINTDDGELDHLLSQSSAGLQQQQQHLQLQATYSSALKYQQQQINSISLVHQNFFPAINNNNAINNNLNSSTSYNNSSNHPSSSNDLQQNSSSAASSAYDIYYQKY